MTTISFRKRKVSRRAYFFNANVIAKEIDTNYPEMTVYLNGFVFVLVGYSTRSDIRLYSNRKKMSKGIFAQFPCRELERTLFASRAVFDLTPTMIHRLLTEVKSIIH